MLEPHPRLALGALDDLVGRIEAGGLQLNEQVGYALHDPSLGRGRPAEVLATEARPHCITVPRLLTRTQSRWSG